MDWGAIPAWIALGVSVAAIAASVWSVRTARTANERAMRKFRAVFRPRWVLDEARIANGEPMEFELINVGETAALDLTVSSPADPENRFLARGPGDWAVVERHQLVSITFDVPHAKWLSMKGAPIKLQWTSVAGINEEQTLQLLYNVHPRAGS